MQLYRKDGQRPWPDTSGGQFLHLDEEKRKEKEILWGASDGLIIEGKRNKIESSFNGRSKSKDR